MVTRYRRTTDNAYPLYSFYLWDNKAHSDYLDYITIVKTPRNETEPEIIKHVPVKDCSGYSIKINKKSLAAGNGARGAFRFIKNCIDTDFMLCWVDKIIDNFFSEG